MKELSRHKQNQQRLIAKVFDLYDSGQKKEAKEIVKKNSIPWRDLFNWAWRVLVFRSSQSLIIICDNLKGIERD